MISTVTCNTTTEASTVRQTTLAIALGAATDETLFVLENAKYVVGLDLELLRLVNLCDLLGTRESHRGRDAVVANATGCGIFHAKERLGGDYTTRGPVHGPFVNLLVRGDVLVEANRTFI